MAWCQEFGPQLHEDCTHAMAAEAGMCRCPACGTTCTGRFAGCARVWAAAPPAAPPAARPVAPVVAPVVAPPTAARPALGDVRSALDAIRSEIEDLRAAEEQPPPPMAVPLPSYDDLLGVSARPRRGRWWKRHRAQHLER